MWLCYLSCVGHGQSLLGVDFGLLNNALNDSLFVWVKVGCELLVEFRLGLLKF